MTHDDPSLRRLRELSRRVTRTYRESRMVVRGLLGPTHPLLVQIVPIRRCNLACSYCNEYDDRSEPVPLDEMLRRIDRLAELRAGIVTLSGGEPMLHPELDAIIRRIRERGMLAGLITNGFYLGPSRIARLNAAGLEYLQISIDNLEPDASSKKSLKTLRPKLGHLAEHARFHVNINSVVGAGMSRPEDPLTITNEARALGFSTSVGILHDGTGALRALSSRQRSIYDEVVRTGQGLYTRINDFQRRLVDGKPNQWKCRAGARYLYVCEDGLVHYCSQQRGRPGISLYDYGQRDLEREMNTEKACAPYCTIGCVHRASALDRYRAQPIRVRGITRGRRLPVVA